MFIPSKKYCQIILCSNDRHYVYVSDKCSFQARNIVKLSYAAMIGISESKLDDSALSSEIHIDNYNILRCDQNRHGGGVVCYIRNDLSYDVRSIFPPESENIFFEPLLPNAKPIAVGIIYRPPNQSDFLEITNTHFSKLDTNNDEIYIPGDSNIKTSILIAHTFSKKIICFRANRFLVKSKIL